MKKLFISLMALVLSSSLALAQMEDAELETVSVAGSIHMIVGPGGNIGVSVGPDGILLVDDKFAPLVPKIREAFEKLGDGKLAFVLNTHWHGDHTGGNSKFGQEAPIIAHTNVRERLSKGMVRGDRKIEPAPKEALPVLTFDSSLSVHFNGEEIQIIHFPKGHTDGDSVVFFTGSNVVHMGDDFFSGLFPFVDVQSGGDLYGLTKNIETIIKKLPADVKIIPGHGPLSGLNDLKEYHRMLVETTEIVRKRVAEGKSLEEIREVGLPEPWSQWSWEFISTDAWLELLYNSVEK